MTTPPTGLLRSALWPIAAVTPIVAAVLIALQPAPVGAVLAGAGLGAMLAAIAFGLGPALLLVARNWPPPAMMALAMASYLTLVGALAVGYLFLLDAYWVWLPAVGWTLLIATVASCLGLIVAVRRVRVLAFDSPVPAAPEA